MKFNLSKYKMLHLEWDNLRYEYRLGEVTETSPVQKVLGLVVVEKLHMSRQWALTATKANHILGCIRSAVASRLSEGISPLIWPCDTPSGVLWTVLRSSAKERRRPVVAGPGKGHGDDQKDGAPLLWKQTERVTVVQPEEEEGETSLLPPSTLRDLKG